MVSKKLVAELETVIDQAFEERETVSPATGGAIREAVKTARRFRHRDALYPSSCLRIAPARTMQSLQRPEPRR